MISQSVRADSSAQGNMEVVRRLMQDVFGQGRFELLDDLVAEDYVGHLSIGDHYGPAGVRIDVVSYRAAFPDLNFWATADLIAEGDFVVGQWEGGGTHTGPAFGDFLAGSLPAATGRAMRFTCTTVL